MPKQEALLRDWSFHWDDSVGANFLRGIVYGHPKITDGRRIHTSHVVKYNVKVGIVETQHTYYKLEGHTCES